MFSGANVKPLSIGDIREVDPDAVVKGKRIPLYTLAAALFLSCFHIMSCADRMR